MSTERGALEPEEVFREEQEALARYWLRGVATAIVGQAVAFVVLAIYPFVPGHGKIETTPYAILLSIAVLAGATSALVPWKRLAREGRNHNNLFAWLNFLWSMLDIGLIAGGVAITGSGQSALYLLYLPFLVQTSIVFTRKFRIALLVAIPASYLISLGLTGWHEGAAILMLRFVLLAMTATLGLFLSTELQKEVILHSKAQKRDLYRATHDLVTGLPNRAAFVETLEASMAAAHTSPDPEHTCPSVIFLDVNDFKLVNDARGHEVGNELLRQIAARLQACAPMASCIARFGGDEFALLTEHRSSKEHLEQDAEAVLAVFNEPFQLEGSKVYATAAIGVALARPGLSAEMVLQYADGAMYEAKRRGAGSIEIFKEHLSEAAMEQATLVSDLHQALERGEFFLTYQPVIRMADGMPVAVEALVRWLHPQKGVIPPVAFIPEAERTGLIAPLGTWVLREAVSCVAAWQANHPELSQLTVSVNVSPYQFRDPNFSKIVKETLVSSGLQPNSLVLEITESLLLENQSEVEQVLADLSQHGVRVAIDDFGTGYSSLSLLASLPIDVLKVDRSFVAPTTRQTDAIVNAIFQMASALELKVVAEGVEEEHQRDRLLALGYLLAQGYLYSRPVRSEEALEYLLKAAKQAAPPSRHTGQGSVAPNKTLTVDEAARGGRLASFAWPDSL